MIRYALKLMRNRLWASPILLALTVAGVALGVASVVTVQLLNLNAIAAFEGTLEATSGGAELIVFPKGRALAADVLPVALGTEGVRAAVPVHQVNVRVDAGVEGEPPRHLKVLGVDLMSGAASTTSAAPASTFDGDYSRLIASPGIAIPEGLAAELSVGVGDSLTLFHGSSVHRLSVAGLLTGAGESAGAIQDIAWSESLFGEGPSQLYVHLKDGAVVADAGEVLQARLGSGVRVTSSVEEGLEARSLLSAFRLNLTALSFISVFVGAFLVYGTTRTTLVRRRGEFGVLRSLGASRAQVLTLILSETLFLGAAGVLIGLPLGYLAARANMDAVSGTLTNLYLLDALETLTVPSWLWALAVVVGVGSALIGGLLPAIETTSRRIRSLLSSVPTYGAQGSTSLQLGLAAAGSVVAALSLTLFTEWIHRGLAAAFLLVVALPLVAGSVVEGATKPFRPRRLGISYAISSLSHRLTSAGVAVAGLAIAVTMMVGITVMVWSFRNSLSDWIDATVRADLYVSAAAWRGDRDSPGLAPTLVGALGGIEGLSAMDRVRGFSGRAAGRPVALRGVDMSLPDSLARFHRLSVADPSLDPAATGPEVFVSEPFVRKTGLSVGDSVPLDTPQGTVFPTIVAVLRDYGNERGAITMDLEQMDRWFGAGEPHGAALYLEAGADLDGITALVETAAREYGVTVRPNRFLRSNALAVFDQTFRITLILQGMALVVATVGVMLTLLVLGYDEAGVLALYRALGATRRQVFGFFMAKGIAIALIGTVLGLAAGGALAAILIFVTNPSYFGWSLDAHVPGLQILRQVLWIMAVAGLASVYPAFLASRPQSRALNPIEA